MIRRIAILAGIGLGLLGMTAAITLIALEGDEVVLLRATSPDGGVHEARVWIVEDAGTPWIEVADADKSFYRAMMARRSVEIVRRGEARSYRPVPVRSDEAHARLRGLLRAKYGWADRWIGVLVDTSDSIPVRLDPIALD